MRPSSILNLPSEIILHVFQSVDSFAEVVALNRTRRIFHDTWRLNATSICNAVLPQAIDCFFDAQELVRAQDHQQDHNGYGSRFSH